MQLQIYLLSVIVNITLRELALTIPVVPDSYWPCSIIAALFRRYHFG